VEPLLGQQPHQHAVTYFIARGGKFSLGQAAVDNAARFLLTGKMFMTMLPRSRRRTTMDCIDKLEPYVTERTFPPLKMDHHRTAPRLWDRNESFDSEAVLLKE